jgi:hypothetical protein
MSRGRTFIDQPDLIVCALAALLGGLGATGALDGVPALRVIVTLPLVLILPGYALVTTLFPARGVPAVERLLMTLGASIALAILTGLALGVSPFGIGPTTWPAALVGETFVLVTLAWLRRVAAGATGLRPRASGMPIRGVVMVAISVLIAADAVLGARIAATDSQGAVPVQLWLIPASDAHDQGRLGMRSGPDGGHFVLALTSQGETIHSFSLDLAPEQTWETIVLFPETIRSQPIVARLYQGTSTTELRFVTLQPATGASSTAGP